MQIKKTLSTTLLLLSFFGFAFSQQKVISGQVIDKITHLGLQGVTVKIEEKQTLTNKKGEFRISVDSNVVSKSGLTFSSVGYQQKKVSYIDHNVYQIQLELSVDHLAEVAITAGAEAIIEKAIRKIPVNYPASPFMMDGILRTHHVHKDSVNTYEYFQNDAVFKIYHPSYAKENDDAQVSVVQNKYKLFKSDKQRLFPVLWVDAYLTPVKDFVFIREDFVVRTKMKNFEYTLNGKSVVDGRKVYVVDFQSKNRGQKGTLYIDEMTYAFVGANYNRGSKGFINHSIATSTRNLTYKMVGDRWFLDQFGIVVRYKDNRYHYSADYKTISIDTVNVKPLAAKDIIKPYTDDVEVRHSGNDSTWKTYQPIFERAQRDGAISNITPPEGFVDQSQIPSKTKPGFLKTVLGYLAKDNMRYTLKFSRLPFDFASSQPALDKDISTSSIYAVGSGLQLRLYKGLFAEVSSSDNYNLGGIRNKVSEYNLTYNFELNKHHQLITISPILGYAKFTSAEKKITWFTQESFTGGLTVSYALGRRLGVYAGGNYNLSSSITNQGLLVNTKKTSPYLGIIYKIK